MCGGSDPTMVLQAWREAATMVEELETTVKRCAGDAPFVVGGSGHGSRLRFPEADSEEALPIDRTKRLSSGHRMPLLGYGTTDYEKGDSERQMGAALKAGYTMLDLAHTYKNEQAVPGVLESAQIDRDQIFLATKLDPKFDEAEGESDDSDDGSDGVVSVASVLPKQLHALQTKRIDLYYLHHGCPPEDVKCKERYMGEYREMERRVASGQIGSLGVSNMAIRHLRELHQQATVPPAVYQLKHSIYHSGVACSPIRHQEVLQAAFDLNMTVNAYGVLSSWPQEIPPIKDPFVAHLAELHRVEPAQILLRHSLQLGLAVLARSGNETRMRRNLDIWNFRIEPSGMRLLNGLAWLTQVCGAPLSGDALGLAPMLQGLSKVAAVCGPNARERGDEEVL